MKAWFPEETKNFLIDGRMLIMRKGKHNVRIVELIDDEEFKRSGKIYPGQPYTGHMRRLKEELKKQVAEDGVELSDMELTRMAERQRDRLRVANNPNIELPDKQEIRERNNSRGGNKDK
jgi:tyrosyl-tRNA synthetase